MAHEIYRDDVEVEFPQGGERIVGLANLLAMREAHPARLAFASRRMRGGGDLCVTEGEIAYDGGPPMRTVGIMELRGGMVAHETIYVGERWEPPA